MTPASRSLRHSARPRTSFAAGSGPIRGGGAFAPRSWWRRFAEAGSALRPFAAVPAALAGILFLVLLPICGIASLVEGLARACWKVVRPAIARRDRGAMSQD